MLLKADAMQPAYDDLVRALEINPNDTVALDGLLRAAVSLNKVIEVERLLTRLAANPANTGANWRCLAGWPRRATWRRRPASRSSCFERTRRRGGARATGIDPVD